LSLGGGGGGWMDFYENIDVPKKRVHSSQSIEK
jgi:hypothetical protein